MNDAVTVLIQQSELLALQKYRLEKELEDINSIISDTSVRLKGQLAAGGTTGDRVADLVYQVHGYHPEIIQCYRTVAQRMAGKKGEVVLLAFRCGQTLSSHMYGESVNIFNSIFRFALLDGEDLVAFRDKGLSHTTVTLPTSQYVHITTHDEYLMHHTGIPEGNKTLKENIFSSCGGYISLLQVVHPDQQHNKHQAQLYVGDKEVKNFLTSKHAPDELFDAIAEKLGRLILRPTD